MHCWRTLILGGSDIRATLGKGPGFKTGAFRRGGGGSKALTGSWRTVSYSNLESNNGDNDDNDHDDDHDDDDCIDEDMR